MLLWARETVYMQSLKFRVNDLHFQIFSEHKMKGMRSSTSEEVEDDDDERPPWIDWGLGQCSISGVGSGLGPLQ